MTNKRLAHMYGTCFTPGLSRAVAGVSLTYEQFDAYTRAIVQAHEDRRTEGGWLTAPPEEQGGAGIHVYHPDLVDEDFCPTGVVEASYSGSEWVGAVWDGCQDCWNTMPVKIAMWKPIFGPTL